MAARLFNGLTRAEVRTLVLAEIKSELHDRLDDKGQAPAKIQYTLAAEFAGYPAEDASFSIRMSGRAEGICTLIPEQIIAQLKNHFDADTRFAAHLTFPKVSWNWHLDLALATGQPVVEAKPIGRAVVTADGKHIDLTLLGVQPVRDESGASEAALADPHSAGIRRATTRMLATGVNTEQSVSDLRERDILATRETLRQFDAERAQPSALETRLDRLEAMLKRLITDPNEPVLVRGITPARPVLVERPPFVHTEAALPVGKISDVRNKTGTGLDITGGAKPSPGVEAAASYGSGAPVGTAQTREVVERITLAHDHPGLDEGGVGAPDAVRRAAGLPIPQRQEVKGSGVVDLPLGSF